MKYLILLFTLIFSLTLSAKLDISQYKDSVKLGEQVVSINKAQIIINKMPSIGKLKSNRYIIVDLKADDGKKIKSDYKILTLSFPSCTRRFSKAVTEIREDSCVVRGLPTWAGEGVFMALEIEDSQGKRTKIKTNASAIEVH